MTSFGEILLLFILSSFAISAKANLVTPKFDDRGTTDPDNGKFIDPSVNYEKFMGRVSDKSDSGKILKIKVSNNNTKFLKVGDELLFKVNNHNKRRFCRGSVRSVEDYYFAISVQDFSQCWGRDQYFPRGTQLNFTAKVLSERVFSASKYREILILRKDGFLKQLNGINHFLWTYEQQKLKTAAKFDERINELRRSKQVALDRLIQNKQDNLVLQGELIKKLDSVDQSLDHYKIERREYLVDRWNMDHDQSLPFGREPQKEKQLKK